MTKRREKKKGLAERYTNRLAITRTHEVPQLHESRSGIFTDINLPHHSRGKRKEPMSNPYRAPLRT